MFDPKDKFSLPETSIDQSTAALRGIEAAMLELKARYLAVLAAAVAGKGGWEEVARARANLDEAAAANVFLGQLWPD